MHSLLYEDIRRRSALIMENAQESQEFTVKSGKKIVFDGHVYDLSEDSDESSEREISSRPKTDWALPQCSDGT